MITLGVNGGISARSCRPAAAPILEPQDRNVVLGRGPVPVICLSSLRAIRLGTGRIVPGTDIRIVCPAAGKSRRRQRAQ